MHISRDFESPVCGILYRDSILLVDPIFLFLTVTFPPVPHPSPLDFEKEGNKVFGYYTLKKYFFFIGKNIRVAPIYQQPLILRKLGFCNIIQLSIVLNGIDERKKN